MNEPSKKSAKQQEEGEKEEQKETAVTPDQVQQLQKEEALAAELEKVRCVALRCVLSVLSHDCF